jgi:hypothetical protein
VLYFYRVCFNVNFRKSDEAVVLLQVISTLCKAPDPFDMPVTG